MSTDNNIDFSFVFSTKEPVHIPKGICICESKNKEKESYLIFTKGCTYQDYLDFIADLVGQDISINFSNEKAEERKKRCGGLLVDTGRVRTWDEAITWKIRIWIDKIEDLLRL